MTEKNPWQTTNSKLKYENPWIRVDEHRVINPGGADGIYGVVHFKNEATAVVALDDDNHIWLVGQYRYALNEYSWELPEGGTGGGDPLEAAKRELKEEAGLVAQHWRFLQRVHLSNSVSDEVGHIYLARNISIGEAAPEECEELKVKRIALKEAYEMVCRGEITDSLSVIGILRVFGSV